MIKKEIHMLLRVLSETTSSYPCYGLSAECDVQLHGKYVWSAAVTRIKALIFRYSENYWNLLTSLAKYIL